MDHVLLTCSPLNYEQIHNLVVDGSCGAISCFIGTTRNNFESKQVLSLEYEAYEPMAIKEMKKICHELRCQWNDLVNIAIYHRLGLVKVQEASVIIAISSPHRPSALYATAKAIDLLKSRVPIWKKELYEKCDADWKENKECPWISKLTNREPPSNLDVFYQSAAPDTEVLKDFVQISVSQKEIDRRIESFSNKKRGDINLHNTMDFLGAAMDCQSNCTNENTCARTHSMVIKSENSRGHLKVRRTHNLIGPQTRKPGYLQALDKHMLKKKLHHSNSTENVDGGNPFFLRNSMNHHALKRLSTIENFLQVSGTETQPISKKIKEIENRLLFLEAISPEYKHFLGSHDFAFPDVTRKAPIKKVHQTLNRKKTSFTINRLDDLIKHYKRELENNG